MSVLSVEEIPRTTVQNAFLVVLNKVATGGAPVVRLQRDFHPKCALAFCRQKAQSTPMTDVSLLLRRIDRQARRASAMGVGSFVVSTLLGASVVWVFSGRSILPSGDAGGYRAAFGEVLASLDISATIGRMILHVGAIIVAVLVLRLMFGFGREQCRLAASLRMFGNLVLLSEGDPETLTGLAAALLPADLDGLLRPPALPPSQRALDQ